MSRTSPPITQCHRYVSPFSFISKYTPCGVCCILFILGFDGNWYKIWPEKTELTWENLKIHVMIAFFFLSSCVTWAATLGLIYLRLKRQKRMFKHHFFFSQKTTVPNVHILSCIAANNHPIPTIKTVLESQDSLLWGKTMGSVRKKLLFPFKGFKSRVNRTSGCWDIAF